MLHETIGILGGGQLGRMLVDAANKLNIKTIILDKTPCPASQLTASINGDFNNELDIKSLADKVDILTIEIEHVNVAALESLIINTHPSPSTIKTIQDKYIQKLHLKNHNLPIPDFKSVDSYPDLLSISLEFGFPMVLKTRKLAYDGRGNFMINSQSDIQPGLNALGSDLYVEKHVDFVSELAVMVAKSTTNEISLYPVVETIQKNGVCDLVIAPAQIPSSIAKKAQQLAIKVVESFNSAGIFGVEMFYCRNGDLLINEVAPRPHNSGHYTIDACTTCQFQQHIRAISGLRLGDTRMRVPFAVMVNIMGIGSSLDDSLKISRELSGRDGVSIQLYGKSWRLGRKLGHINITGTISSVTRTLESVGIRLKITPIPKVGIIMGSDSDLPVMKAAAEILESFNVPVQVTIVSAHRTPDRMIEYARAAVDSGIKVIIAGAGGAAHLPGMVAACTPLPVIGVPVALKHLDGVDSLYSICQMPVFIV